MSAEKPRILVVEDDEHLSAGLKFALEQEAYQVETAANLAIAAAVLPGSSVDLVLLDVGLPDGDGMDFCRRIRRGEFIHQRVPAAVPVIFLTARDDEIDVVRGLELGGDDYVTKPFRLKELLSRIKARLRSGRVSVVGEDGEANRGGVIQAGDLVVDPGSAEVSMGGVAVSLTAVEYRLLLTLLRHAGQVLTRAQLTDSALGASGGFTDDNTISVYIRRLREKIEDNPQAAETAILAQYLLLLVRCWIAADMDEVVDRRCTDSENI